MIQRRTVLAGIGASLLAGTARAQGVATTPSGMQGRVTLTEGGGVRIHTYMAAPQGALVTSHIIEGASGIVLVDGQFMPGPAQELKRYLDSIGKPLVRTMLSHMHPDHWFGLHHAGRPAVHAGPTTVAFLQQNAAQLIAERRADSSVPAIAGTLSAGTETVAGVEIKISRVLDTEAPETMVFEVPAARAVIVQDIVYNKVHAVVPRQLDTWIQVLKGLESGAQPVILAGHGEPATAADLPGLIRYLEAVKPLIAANIGKDPKPIVAEIARQFPDYRIPPLLELGLSRALRA